MISFFKTWLPGIIEYCELITGEKALRKAWIHSDLSDTSVYYPGEMFEQIFGDLDSNLMRQEMNNNISDADLIKAINSFLDALLELETWIGDNFDIAGWSKGEPNPKMAEVVLSSPLWSALTRAAGKVVELGAGR